MGSTEFIEAISVLDKRLTIVTGKGGVGKSALASALALLSARRHPTVLVTLDTQGANHPFFNLPMSYDPMPVGHRLSVSRVDAMSAVREYVRRRMPFPGVYDMLLSSRMFRDFAQAAPGFQELMCLGKLYDLTTGSAFERVIFDAPATGHLKILLDVPKATLAAVHVGPLNHNARKIQDLLLDPERCQVVLAALPEEMAVREALEIADYCRERRMGLGPVIVNQWVENRYLAEEVGAVRPVDQSMALRVAANAVSGEVALAESHGKNILPLHARPELETLKVPRLVEVGPTELAARIADCLAESVE